MIYKSEELHTNYVRRFFFPTSSRIMVTTASKRTFRGSVWGYMAWNCSRGCGILYPGHSGVHIALKPGWAPCCVPDTGVCRCWGRGRQRDDLGETGGGRGCWQYIWLEVSTWKETLHQTWASFWITESWQSGLDWKGPQRTSNSRPSAIGRDTFH